MRHIQGEKLQQYAAGACTQAETQRIGAHLARCSACQAQFDRIAGDDAWLTRALALDADEARWADAVDLTQTVLQALAPRRSDPQHWLIALTLTAALAWGAHLLTMLLAQFIRFKGTVGLALDLLQAGAYGGWLLGRYLAEGGLLAQLWPLLIIGAVWSLRRPRAKEA